MIDWLVYYFVISVCAGVAVECCVAWTEVERLRLKDLKMLAVRIFVGGFGLPFAIPLLLLDDCLEIVRIRKRNYERYYDLQDLRTKINRGDFKNDE